MNLLKRFIGLPSVTAIGNRCAPARVVVVTYHDLRSDNDFPSWLRVSESGFAAQLTELGRLGRFIRPQDLFRPETLSRHRLNVLLTFDDGYVNNYRLALPLLQKHNAPALFFISTWHLETGEPFWFDRIVTPIQALNLMELDLSRFGLRSYQFSTRKAAERWEDVQVVLQDIKAVGNVDVPNLSHLLQYIDQEYGGDVASYLERYRPLRPEEVRQMVASGICTIGSHAHQHAILTYQGDDDLAVDLRASKRILEELSDCPVEHFAYPNGDWNVKVQELVRQAGFAYGFTLSSRLVRQDCDRMQIPRLLIGGYDTLNILRFLVNRSLLTEVLRS